MKFWLKWAKIIFEHKNAESLLKNLNTKTFTFFTFTFLLITSMISFAQVEKIADGFQFVEGPVWMEGKLLFSDIPANTVYQWTEESGQSVFLNPSGNSNGLALDAQGRLILSQHGLRQIARREEDGTITALATHYNGKRLNSPNDLAIKSDGSIFFTDPPWGISAGQEELDFHGIYRLSQSGDVQLLDASVTYPNGIAFSPDESILYADNSGGKTIYAWDIKDDTTLTNKRLFAFMSGNGSADGMKVDSEGNIFATSPYGVNIYAPDGTLLETVDVPDQTTNCAWGDADGNTLYITSGSAIYRMRNNYLKIQNQGNGTNSPHKYQLFDNFPNPFNPQTTIAYTIPLYSKVTLNIFNTLGQHINTLVKMDQQPGYYEVVWNGSDQSGNLVASGMYIFQLNAESFSQIQKMIFLQ